MCSLCGKELRIPENVVPGPYGPIHYDCFKEAHEERQRRYTVVERTSTGYPLRFERNLTDSG